MEISTYEIKNPSSNSRYPPVKSRYPRQPAINLSEFAITQSELVITPLEIAITPTGRWENTTKFSLTRILSQEICYDRKKPIFKGAVADANTYAYF